MQQSEGLAVDAAIEAAAYANREIDGCHAELPETMDAEPCRLCQEMAEASIKAALPILRHQHFQEAASLLDAENEALEREANPTGPPSPYFLGWREATRFLRGLAGA